MGAKNYKVIRQMVAYTTASGSEFDLKSTMDNLPNSDFLLNEGTTFEEVDSIPQEWAIKQASSPFNPKGVGGFGQESRQ